MPAFKDITGQRFGRLVVLSHLETRSTFGCVTWKCLCDCGNETVAIGSNLRSGNTKSCGCLTGESARERFSTHGKSTLNEYKIWKGIRKRCNNPNCKAYHNYGGRGIKLDARWEDFNTFYRDMGPRPSRLHSIERIDNDGNYCPENCKWILRSKQPNNTRMNLRLRLNGVELNIAQWSERLGIHPQTLYSRYRKNQDPEYVLRPVQTR